MVQKTKMLQQYLQIVTAAMSFLHSGSIGQLGNIGCSKLFAKVNDIMAFVLGLWVKEKARELCLLLRY